MEVRCGQCSKLFRVADERITGAGIRFKCTKCGEYITVTREDFENYRLSSDTASVLDTFTPKTPQSAVPPPPLPPAHEETEPESDQGPSEGMDDEEDFQADFPVDESLFSEPTMQEPGLEESSDASAPTDDSFLADQSFQEPVPVVTPDPDASQGESSFLTEPSLEEGMMGGTSGQDESVGDVFFGGAEETSGPNPEADSMGLEGFDIVDDHEDEEQEQPAREQESQEPPSFLASPHEFAEEAVAGAPSISDAQSISTSDEQASEALPDLMTETTASRSDVSPEQRKTAAVTSTTSPEVVPEAKSRESRSRAPEPKPVPSSPPRSTGPAMTEQGTTSTISGATGIHPFASGSLAGTLGGIGCAVPTGVMTVLGVQVLTMVIGEQKAGTPLIESLLMSGASLIGLAVIIGILLAQFQARTERTIFGILGILLGGIISALVGSALGAFVAIGSGAIVSTELITASAMGWGIKGLLVSASVVIARRIALSSRVEMSSASISGGQLLGIGLALLILVLGGISEVRIASSRRSAKAEATKTFQHMVSAEGLQVTSSLASWDKESGDLILNVTIENTTAEEKKPWYLVARVYDSTGKVVTTAKMLTGKQLFLQRDYDVMARRGIDVQRFRMEQRQQKDAPLAPRAVVNIELRVIGPPENVASFDAVFEAVDPLKLIREQVEDAAKQQSGQERMQSR